jgi:hypothetical protein
LRFLEEATVPLTDVERGAVAQACQTGRKSISRRGATWGIGARRRVGFQRVGAVAIKASERAFFFAAESSARIKKDLAAGQVGRSAPQRPHTISGRRRIAGWKVLRPGCELVHMRHAPAQLLLPSRPQYCGRALEVAMAVIVTALSRASGIQLDVETLKTIVMFCGAGLVVSLLLATGGLDLSAGFF